MSELIRCLCTRINDPWRRFCGGCGSGLLPGCGSCGFVNAKKDRFCGGCSKSVTEGDADTIRSKARAPLVRVVQPELPEPQTIPLEIIDDTYLGVKS